MSPLPPSAQYLSLAVTICLAALTIFNFFRRGKVDAVLTYDSKFVLSDEGEIFVCCCILLARHAPVLIRGVEVHLVRKRNSTSKEYTLNVTTAGEKIKGVPKIGEELYYGGNPEKFVTVEEPLRLIYHCVELEYQKQWQQRMESFKDEIRNLANMVRDGRLEPSHVEKRIGDAAAEWGSMIAQEVQLEPGEYFPTLCITYECPGQPERFRTKVEQSDRVWFVVDQLKVDRARRELHSSLVSWGKVLFYGTGGVIWPECSVSRPSGDPKYGDPREK